MTDLLDNLRVFDERAAQIEEKLADPAVASSPGEYAPLAKELSALRPIVDAGARYGRTLAEIEDARGLLGDGAFSRPTVRIRSTEPSKTDREARSRIPRSHEDCA